MTRILGYLAVLLTGVCSARSEAASPLFVKSITPLTPIGLPAGVNFGANEYGVAVSGHLAVVTAGTFFSSRDDCRAFVFDISDPLSPMQIAELRASDNHAGNDFGVTTAISGNFVFVGSDGADNERGAVYMYDMSDPDHVVERKITAFDGAPYASFGRALAVDGHRLIVGSPSYNVTSPPAAAYVLDFGNPDDITQSKLLPLPGTFGGNFAEQVDISGNLAIVGQVSDSVLFPFSGAANLYDLSNLSHIRGKVLRATDPDHRAFGRTVQIDGSTATVSVSSDPGSGTRPGAPDGALWVFDVTDWDSIKQHEFGRSLQSNFTAPFGVGLSQHRSQVVAGAFNEGSGAMYVYDLQNPLAPEEILRIPGLAGSRQFGRVMAFDGRSIVVSGSFQQAYLYTLAPEPSGLAIASVALCALRSATGANGASRSRWQQRPAGWQRPVPAWRSAQTQCRRGLRFRRRRRGC